MMIVLLNPLYRRFFLKAGLSVALLGWAIAASVLLIRNRPETVLIGVDGNGTRIIEENNDPLMREESLRFLKRFLHYYYNYDSQTFYDSLGLATDLMGETLWETQKSEIKKVGEALAKEPASQVASIRSISKLGDQTYQAEIEVHHTQRLKSAKIRVLAKLQLKPAARTRRNPWGMEVETLEEKHEGN